MKKTMAAIFVVAMAHGHAQTVLASNGIRAVLEDLKSRAPKAGVPLAIEYNSTTGLKPKLEAPGYDVAIVTTSAMDQLVKEGHIAAGTRVDLARSGIGIGIRAGAPKPDITTAGALKQALLKAKGVSYAQDGASRAAIEKMFAAMGIADQMKQKIILEQGSVRSGARVAAGDADFVLTLISEILPLPGVELAGALPSEYQSYVNFSAGVAAHAAHAEAGQALV